MTNEELLYEINIAQKDLNKQLDLVEKSFDKTFNSIEKQGSSATSVFKGMIGAEAVKKGMSIAVESVTEGIKKILTETSQLEDATLDWKMLTGNAEEAGLRIKSVYDFANRTPFDTKEVNEAATNLYKVSQGALGAEEDLIRLGDAAKKGNVPIVELSTTYGRLYNKLANGEKAFGDEINRMTDLGLVTFETKQELMAMDTSLLATKGLDKLNADLDKAKGTMAEFSQNISGKMGTLQSTWDQIFAFDDPNIKKGIGDSLDVMISMLQTNKPIIQAILVDTFGVITDIMSEAMDTTVAVWRALNPVKAIKIDNKTSYDASLKGVTSQLKGSSKDVLFDRLEKIEETYGMSQSQVESDLILTGFSSIEDFLADYEFAGKETSKATKDIADFFKTFQFQTLQKTALENTITGIYANQKVIPNGGIITKTDDVTTGRKVDLDFMRSQYSFDGKMSSQVSGGLPYKLDMEQNQLVFEDISLRLIQGRDGLAELNNVINSLESGATTEVSPDKIGGITTMVSSTENAMLGMGNTIKNWSKDTNHTFSEGMRDTTSIMANMSSGLGGVLGGLDQAGVGGLSGLIPGLGLATAGLSLVSSFAGLFSNDDDDEITSSDIAQSNVENRANIVSTGVDTIIINANMSLYTTYVDEAGFDEMFNEQIAPRMAEIVQGAYR